LAIICHASNVFFLVLQPDVTIIPYLKDWIDPKKVRNVHDITFMICDNLKPLPNPPDLETCMRFFQPYMSAEEYRQAMEGVFVNLFHAHDKRLFKDLVTYLTRINLGMNSLALAAEIFFDELTRNTVHFVLDNTEEAKRFLGLLSFDQKRSLFFTKKIPLPLFNYFIEKEKPANFSQIFAAYVLQKLREVAAGNFDSEATRTNALFQTVGELLEFPYALTLSEEQQLAVSRSFNEELKRVPAAPASPPVAQRNSFLPFFLLVYNPAPSLLLKCASIPTGQPGKEGARN